MTAKYYLQTSIIEKLKTIAGIGSVGLWNNQFANEHRERPIKYPCVFVSIPSIDWEQRRMDIPSLNSYKHKNAKVDFILHVGFELYDDETRSLEEVDTLLEVIKFELEGVNSNEFNHNYFNDIMLIREEESEDYNTVKDYMLTFSTYILQPPYKGNLIDADDINPEITKENGL